MTKNSAPSKLVMGGNQCNVRTDQIEPDCVDDEADYADDETIHGDDEANHGDDEAIQSMVTKRRTIRRHLQKKKCIAPEYVSSHPAIFITQTYAGKCFA